MNKVQPAKKSYFFGQGYRDIYTAIRGSWLENGEAAREYYYRYDNFGLMSFRGIFYLLCAISVVTFGTALFAIISLGTLLFVSLFFVLIYIGFTFTWLIDRIYLARKKIFTACNQCKNKFLIPTYICPSCGAQHTNLTPGVYGILKRTCNCGEKLPTAFFNGRRGLQAICPECVNEGQQTLLSDRESRPICIPVIGGRSVGKTAYITAFSKMFVEDLAPAKGMDIEFYNKSKEDIYSEIETDFAHGSTRMTIRPQDITKSSSESFSFFVKHPKLRPERLFHVYDIAGEVFTDNNENEVQRQYEYCHGIVFIIDPFGIPSVNAKYGESLTPEDRAGIGHADINGIINVFINKLREVTGLSDRQMSKVPIAILISKIDSGSLYAEFSEERISKIQSADPERPMDREDAMDYLCREFLRENNMESFLNAIDMKFSRNKFFAISAIGHTRDAGEYNPMGVFEPMKWIVKFTDKMFFRIWSREV